MRQTVTILLAFNLIITSCINFPVYLLIYYFQTYIFVIFPLTSIFYCETVHMKGWCRCIYKHITISVSLIKRVNKISKTLLCLYLCTDKNTKEIKIINYAFWFYWCIYFNPGVYYLSYTTFYTNILFVCMAHGRPRYFSICR